MNDLYSLSKLSNAFSLEKVYLVLNLAFPKRL